MCRMVKTSLSSLGVSLYKLIWVIECGLATKFFLTRMRQNGERGPPENNNIPQGPRVFHPTDLFFS